MAVRAAPASALPLFALGRLLEQRRRLQEALFAYEAALLRAPLELPLIYTLGRLSERLKLNSRAALLYHHGRALAQTERRQAPFQRRLLQLLMI